MFCPNCGKRLEAEDGLFCPSCGERLPQIPLESVLKDTPPAEPEAAVPVAPEADIPEPGVPEVTYEAPVQTVEKPKKKTRVGLLVGCIGGGLLLVALALLLLVVMPEQRRVKQYNEGVDLLNQSKFIAAADQFRQLGAYADAEKMAEYAVAMDELTKGNYKQAADAFTRLGDFMDASSQLAVAKREMLYADGVKALQQGDYAKAIAALEQIPDFKDAGALVQQCRNHMAYEEAQALFSSGSYAEALARLEGVSGLPEAETLRKQCENWVAYAKALEKYEAGAYAEALAQLENVQDLAEAETLRKNCQDRITYENALKKYEAGAYAEAAELFAQVPKVENAANLLKDCQKQIQYDKIKTALDKKDWANALTLLNADLSKDYPDRKNAINLCQNHIKYAGAVEDLAAGKNYAAYQAFTSLGKFEDAAEKAKSCVVSKPKNGETYRNSKYSKADCRQWVVTPNDGIYTYMKIYSKKGSAEELVSCLFIHPGKTVKITLPAGEYIFKVAYGKGNWYGEIDMFGDEGNYQRVGGANGVLTRKKLSSSQYYELKLRVGSGGNLGSSKVGRNGF